MERMLRKETLLSNRRTIPWLIMYFLVMSIYTLLMVGINGLADIAVFFDHFLIGNYYPLAFPIFIIKGLSELDNYYIQVRCGKRMRHRLRFHQCVLLSTIFTVLILATQSVVYYLAGGDFEEWWHLPWLYFVSYFFVLVSMAMLLSYIPPSKRSIAALPIMVVISVDYFVLQSKFFVLALGNVDYPSTVIWAFFRNSILVLFLMMIGLSEKWEHLLKRDIILRSMRFRWILFAGASALLIGYLRYSVDPLMGYFAGFLNGVSKSAWRDAFGGSLSLFPFLWLLYLLLYLVALTDYRYSEVRDQSDFIRVRVDSKTFHHAKDTSLLIITILYVLIMTVIPLLMTGKWNGGYVLLNICYFYFIGMIYESLSLRLGLFAVAGYVVLIFILLLIPTRISLRSLMLAYYIEQQPDLIDIITHAFVVLLLSVPIAKFIRKAGNHDYT